MPRYNTLDPETNLSELDPCLAAEVRLKDKSNCKWIILAGVLLFLLLLAVVGVLVWLLVFSTSAQPSEMPKTHQVSEPEAHEIQTLNQTNSTINEVPTNQSVPTTSDPPQPPFQAPDKVNEPAIETSTAQPVLITPVSQAPTRIFNQTDVPSNIIVMNATGKLESQEPEPVSTTLPPPPIPTRQVYVPPKVLPRSSYINASEVSHVNTYGNVYATCSDYLKNGFTQSGVYRLYRAGVYDFSAHCMMDDKKNEAWVVLQKRTSGVVPFWNRTFEEYSSGFGDVQQDHWLGLEKIRYFVESGHKLQMRMEIEGNRCVTPGQKQTNPYYVGTWNVEIGPKDENYRLHVSPMLSGNFTEPLSNIEQNNGLQFNAKEKDNGGSPGCLENVHMGGWWTAGKEGCTFISLNGRYTCDRLNSLYGLAIAHKRSITEVKYVSDYIRPASTRILIRVCDSTDSQCSR